MAHVPAPIDPRGPRTNQGVMTVALLVSFLTGWWVLVPVWAVILGLGVVGGPQANPVMALYARVIRPRLGPPSELEDPRPPRFAATIGVVFLGAATLAFAAGADTAGWVLALIVAALAGLAATTGICVGCEIYLAIARRRGIEVPA